MVVNDAATASPIAHSHQATGCRSRGSRAFTAPGSRRGLTGRTASAAGAGRRRRPRTARRSARAPPSRAGRRSPPADRRPPAPRRPDLGVGRRPGSVGVAPGVRLRLLRLAAGRLLALVSLALLAVLGVRATADGLPSGLVDGTGPGRGRAAGRGRLVGSVAAAVVRRRLVGLAGSARGRGWLALALGGAVPDSSSHENATIPPSGHVQRRRRRASCRSSSRRRRRTTTAPRRRRPGAVFTHGSLVGTPLTRHTKPGWREA